MAGVSSVLAGLAWFVPWTLGTAAVQLIGGVQVGILLMVTALIVGLLATPLLERVAYARRARLRLIEDLERRVSALEHERSVLPVPRIQFEYNNHSQLARLHVTNHGHEAEFRASLMIDGGLSARLDAAVFARWEHTDRARTAISRGETRTLRLARLDLSSFPFAQWEVYMTADQEQAAALPAMHASVIGGAPDAQAPTMCLELSILTVPEPAATGCTCTIALHAFDAQLLR